MTMKFMEEGLRFGRTWVDRIMGKVDKDQGVANAGKVLGIGADGIVTPVEQSGGGGSDLPFTASNALPIQIPSYIIIANCQEVNIPTSIKLSSCNLETKTATATVGKTKRTQFVLFVETGGSPSRYEHSVHHFAFDSTVVVENTQETKPYSISGTIILEPMIFRNSNSINFTASAIIESCKVDGIDVTPSFTLNEITANIVKAVYFNI